MSDSGSVGDLLQALRARPFSVWSYEEKCLAKNTRPMPNLDVQIVDGKQNRKFQYSWYVRYPWLTGCDKTKNLFCYVCMLFGGENKWTLQGIPVTKNFNRMAEKHQASKKHLQNQQNHTFLGRWRIEKEASRVEQALGDVKAETPDAQEMAVAGPSSADPGAMDVYPQRGVTRPTNWTVPQQAPPGSKPAVAPSPPVKKSLPLVSQPSPKPVIAKPAPPRPVSPPQPPPPPPEVCLRWNSYHSNMQATFPSLLNNEQFVDVTLACEGRSIKCHKVMLSACSSYFEELLSQNPCQHPIVLMKDLKFWEVQALVDFMYRGEVNVGQDKLPSLLAAAEALQIKGLAGPASTSSSHDEDSLPPTLPLATDDYMDESTPSSSSARRARKRRTIASLPTPRQNTISPHRNPVGRPRLIRPSPQPSTSTYHQTSLASEPPLRRARRSEPTSLPVGEIKIEPVDIDISNDSVDPVDDGFDINKTYDGSGGGGSANDSSRQGDDIGVDSGGGSKRELTGDLSDDNKAITSGHDSDHMDYSSNNGDGGLNCEQSMAASGGSSKAEVQGYSYAERNTDDPGMSSSDINPTYPEVVLNPGPDNASSDSILGHL